MLACLAYTYLTFSVEPSNITMINKHAPPLKKNANSNARLKCKVTKAPTN